MYGDSTVHVLRIITLSKNDCLYFQKKSLFKFRLSNSHFTLTAHNSKHFDTMNENIHQPSLFREESISSLTAWAMTQPRNVEHFMQVQVYPIVGATVLVDSDDKVHVNMRFVDNTEDNCPADIHESVRLGHLWHTQDITRNPNVIDIIKMKNWKKKHMSICPKIDKAIEAHHGIPCYLEGPSQSSNPRNHVVLHFCDVLVIKMLSETNQAPPRIVLPGTNFETISNAFTDTFFDTELTSAEKYFVFFNADIYYHIYGIWHNYSHKPIRVDCSGIVSLSRSGPYTQNDLFRRHQNGKYTSLDRRVSNEITRNFYNIG